MRTSESARVESLVDGGDAGDVRVVELEPPHAAVPRVREHLHPVVGRDRVVAAPQLQLLARAEAHLPDAAGHQPVHVVHLHLQDAVLHANAKFDSSSGVHCTVVRALCQNTLLYCTVFTVRVYCKPRLARELR